MTIRKFDVDLPERAIVTLISRVVRDEILRSELFRDFGERTLERKHVASEKRDAARFLGQRLQVAIFLVGDLACFDARHRREKTSLGRNRKDRRLGALRDVDRVVDIGAAVGVLAVSYEKQDTATRK